MTAIPLSQLATSRRWQKNFLSVLPVVQNHAAVSFRHLHAEARAEATAHAVASAVVSYHALVRQDKLSQAYPGTLATFAVKAVNGGRQVGGHINSKDVLNPLAQKRRNIVVRSISRWDRQEGNWRDMVLETRRATPADQAAFNLDFHDWLQTWSRRDRQIIYQLAAGNGTFAVARRFRISPARVSQLRRRYQQSWTQFQGMPVANAA